MLPRELEQALRDLPRTGRLVKDRPYRQVWRFEVEGRPYYLKFFPARGWRDSFRRFFRGSPALREFYRLQWLQKAAVPSPRAVAVLLGFNLQKVKGDALIIEGLEPSVQLDKYLNQCELEGRDPAGRLAMTRELIKLLEKLGRAGLGHSDLHLGNILLKDGKPYLLDGYSVHRGGMRMKDLSLMALGVQPHATRTDLHRAWKQLGGGGPMPARNPRGRKVWRDLLARVFKNDGYFGHLKIGNWSGHFFKHSKFPQRWSVASALDINEKDWQEAFPLLLNQIESDQFEALKRSRSGDVLSGEIVLGGRPLSVIIKRPRRRHWWRYINEIGRGTRARRAWKRAWQLIVRNIPTAWPLLMMEKRRLGYPTDAIIVFERIAGPTLAQVDPAARPGADYRLLLRRCGRMLRRLEQTGLYLYDSKATNWMIRQDGRFGPMPMLIDVDGVRRLNQGGGLQRLLRSLREQHSARFTYADAEALARGYAPFADARRLAKLIGPPPASDSPAPRCHAASARREGCG